MALKFDASLDLGAFHYEGRFDALDELVVPFGHSGAGKSVTLRMIAGLLRPRRGRIVIDDRVVDDPGARIHVPPQQRRVGYVVQDLALFPHLTVAGNVQFGMPPGPADARQRRTRELLALLGLEGYDDRMPATLSGGQRQRVALARALAREAGLLLLDEPFSALDESLREGLRRELLRLRHELGLTIVFVTHDLREAHLLADRLAVFDEGRLLQFGPRETVFRRPDSRRVAELTGFANILPATVVQGGEGSVVIECRGARLQAASRPAGVHGFREGQQVFVAIRAERVILRRPAVSELPGANVFPAVVTEELSYGSVHGLRLEPVAAGPALSVELADRPYEVLDIASRKDWTVELPPADLHVMPA